MSDPDLDCGDNSCLFAAHKGGMRTNGGCRCLSDLPHVQRRQVTKRIKQAEARVQELEEGIRKIIAYEWGKPGDGYEVAPAGFAVPAEQKAWRALAALVPERSSDSISDAKDP